MTDTATTTVRNHSMDLYRVCALLFVVMGPTVQIGPPAGCQ